MSLGYALLHPQRIESALAADARKKTFDEAGDVTLGVIGAGDLSATAGGFFDAQLSDLEAIMEQLQGLVADGGPLAVLGELFDRDLGSTDDLGDLLHRFTATLENLDTAVLRERLCAWLDRVLDGLPTLDGRTLSAWIDRQLRQLTEVLEQPLRGGRRDAAAHRSFRAAVTLRLLLSQALAGVAAAAPDLDLRAALKIGLDRLLAQLDELGTERITRAVRLYKQRFGGLFRAFGSLDASFSVSVSVGGPQGMAESEPGYRDEVKAVPHTRPGDPIWITDLVTNIFATFHLIWEMVRTDNWAGRPMDGILSLINILWQAARTVVRAVWPDAVNKQSFEPGTEDPNDTGKRFVNWLFTDQGDFSVNLLLRFLAAFHEVRAFSNWILSIGQRSLKYFTNVVSFRLFYLFARSWWYLRDWQANDDGHRPDMNRMMFAVFPVMWFVAAIFGAFQPWEDFNLNDLQDLTLAMLIVSALVGLALGYVVLGLLTGRKNPFTLIFAPDSVSLGILGGTLVLAVLLLLGIVNELENDQTTAACIVLFVVLAFVLAGLITLPILFAQGNNASELWQRIFSHELTIIAGLLGFGILPFISWMFYIDDGRDRGELFDGLDAAGSPYLLPYRQGESWFIGQGPHGLFSHVPTEIDNHYAYDFNEYEDQPALAARGGVVVNVLRNTPNGEAPGNRLEVQHLSWAEGNDPGSRDEGVLTYTTYLHLSQNRVWADVGHRLVQGYHLADIDNTGTSAQHHLHHDVRSSQDSTERSIPYVFADGSLERFRNYPFLACIEGKGRIRGKPLSFAFYVSDNAEQDPVVNPTVLGTSQAGTPAHGHNLAIDRRALGTGALPASVTLRTTVAQGHDHPVTLSRDQLIQLLRFRDPTVAAIATAAAEGHSHLLAAPVPAGLNAAAQPITVVPPPAGQLLARRPAPYRLVGDQFVVRVNRRAIEYFFYGALRPVLAADVALDRGLAGGHALDVDGAGQSLPAATTDLSAGGTVRALNAVLRGAGATVVARAVPVLVLETRRRGSGAAIEVTTGSTTAPLLAAGRPTRGVGSGAFADLRQIPRNALAAHFDTVLKTGWPAAPAGLNVAVNAGRLTIADGGAAVDLSGGSARVSEVLTGLYDAGNTRLRATGPLPLASGRVAVDAYQAPVLAAPARVRVDVSGAAFTGGGLTATPLQVTVLGAIRQVSLQAGEGDPAVLARRIMAEVEGVRAWPDGGALAVETVAAGPRATLTVSKAGPTAAANVQETDTGAAPVLSFPGGTAGGALGDTTALELAELRAVLRDAAARDTLPYDPVAAGIGARIEAERLALEVGDGHTIAIAGQGFTGTDAPFNFTSPSSGRFVFQLLPDPFALAGPAWVDVDVDGGNVVRVPLDGEVARLDLGPFERLPANGETLALDVGGTAVNVAFDGSERNVAEVAARVSQASALYTVRVAYALSLESSMYGPTYAGAAGALELQDSNGLALAGFLRDRAALSAPAIGVGADQLRAPANLDAPRRADGVPITAMSLREEAAGANFIWHLDASSGLQLQATAVPGDPLGFAAAGPAATLSSPPLGATWDLGGPCQDYVFEALDAAGGVVARGELQISASPAIARADGAPTLPLPASADLTVTVIEPAGGGTAERVHGVDLAGSATLDEVAARIDAAVPAVRAWVARPTVGGAAALRLHLETLGGGTGWRLRLDNPQLLIKLGYDPAEIDFDAEVLEIAGRGGVRDSRAVTRDETRALLHQRAVACMTGLTAPGAGGGTLQPNALQVEAAGADLVLRSAEGPVAVTTAPPSLRAALALTEAGGTATLAPGAGAALDNGTIVVQAAGRTLAAVEIFGDRATVRADAPLPADPTAGDGQSMLNRLKAHPLRIRVDGAIHTAAPVPAAAANFDDAIEHIASEVPAAWIGLVPDAATPANRHVVIETRGRGSARTVAIDFSQFAGPDYPAETLLGFEATQLQGPAVAQWIVDGDPGSGNVPDLGAVTTLGAAPDTLESLLRAGAARGAARQSVYDAEVDATAVPPVLRLRANVAAWTLSQPAAGPGGLQLMPPSGAAVPARVIEAQWPGAPAVRPGLLELEATIGGPARGVRALIAGQPARLPPLGLPASLDVLNGRGVRVAAGTASFAVTFAAPAGVTGDDLAAQVERACGWQVRATAVAGELRIETAGAGSARSLTLSAPTGATPNAVTGDPATGLQAPSPLPLAAQGTGTVPDVEAVSAEHYRQALLDAYLNDLTNQDQAARGSRRLDWRAYQAAVPPPGGGAPAIPDFFTLTSPRDGCISAVEAVVDDAPVLDFERGLERGPAIRGSVRLPAFTDARALAGTLRIELDDNGGIEDLPALRSIEVAFPAGDYSPEAVAERVHEELFGRGAGQAAAYPDGSVVVETHVPGLAGLVRIPAQPLLQTLGSAEALEGRGWPGMGFAGGAVLPGFRSRQGAAGDDAFWQFGDGTSTSPVVSVTSGQTLETIRGSVESALRPPAAAGARMGICQIGTDGTLYIEGAAAGFILQIGPSNAGPFAALTPPANVALGATPERAEEPAVGLRLTQETRTFRFVRERFGDGDLAQIDDAGWVRAPANPATGAPVFPGNYRFPPGRYLLAVRADAAKTRDYHASGEMIASAGTHPGDANRHFVHQARYWVALQNGQLLRVARTAGGDYLVDFLL